MKVILLIMIGLSILNAEFIKNGDIVLDTTTNLEWQDNNISSDSYTDWADANKRCEDLSLGTYDDWRLPNINELASIVERESDNSTFYYKEAILKHNDKSFWSSTSGLIAPDEAWYVNKDITDKRSKYIRNNARCVRDAGTIYIK